MLKILKAVVTAYLLGAAAAPALAEISPETQARTDIQTRATALAGALTASNRAAVNKILTPDFSGVDMDGQPVTAAKLIAAAHPGGRAPKIEVLIAGIYIEDGAAHVERLTLVPDGKATGTKAAQWGYISHDVWTSTGGVWRLQSTRAVRAGHLVNGKMVEQREAALHVAPPDSDPSLPDMSEGNPKAKVTVIEYGSVACPICAMVNQTTMPAFFAKYVATGKVRFVYRPMETGNPAVARQGHALAECAGPDKYFSVVDAIQRAQPEMDKGGEPEQYVNAQPVLASIGATAGMSSDQITACFADTARLESLDRRNATYLQRDGIDGTPTFLVNGKRVEGDLKDPHLLDNAVAPLLK